jgi:acetylornithine deacetylase/succinyl-diaminopimelate desuccinylase-like protein
MDRRLIPSETRRAALAEIEELLARYDQEVEPLTFELHSEGEVAPNVNTPVDSPFVELAQDCLAAVTGEPRPLVGYALTSDGRWFAGLGIPIIHFGPGDPALAHASDEYVEIFELVEAVRFYVSFALRWCEANVGR